LFACFRPAVKLLDELLGRGLYMKLGIVTDSTSDLPQHIIDEHGIEVVPAVLVLDGQSYADGEVSPVKSITHAYRI
jgi:phosphoglycolate phosphatase-like HAD superfamily hydrolase